MTPRRIRRRTMRSSFRRSYFYKHGVALAAAGADGREAFAASSAAQLIEERRQDACARRAHGVAQRQCAAVDVDDIGVHAEYPRGVYLDQVQVVRAPSGSFEREFARVSWNSEQVGRFLGYFGVRHDGAERFEAALFGEALTREHEGAGAVCDARGVARGHGAAFVYGLESRQLLQGGVAPDRLVGLDVVYLSFFARDFDADDLFG